MHINNRVAAAGWYGPYAAHRRAGGIIGGRRMNRVPSTIAVVLALVAATSQVAFAKERTPPGSFLRYRATSVAQLVNEVKTDPVARARFANHFGVSQDGIGEYFASRLKLVNLTAPLKVKIWFVGQGGAIYSKNKLLPKGTPLFVTHEGTPLILWSCGNPLRSALPESLKVSEPEPVDAVEVKPAPVEAIAAAAVAAVPAPTAAAVLPAAIPVTADIAVASTISAAPPVLGGLGVLSLLGGLVAHSEDSTPWVPEPSGLVALGTGILAAPAALAIRRRRETGSK